MLSRANESIAQSRRLRFRRCRSLWTLTLIFSSSPLTCSFAAWRMRIITCMCLKLLPTFFATDTETIFVQQLIQIPRLGFAVVTFCSQGQVWTNTAYSKKRRASPNGESDMQCTYNVQPLSHACID